MIKNHAVKAAFREYYFKQKLVETPDNIEQREFGYSQFDIPGMVRHLSFKSAGELVALLVKEVPSDVYCSNALYRFPTLSMQEKQWQGADLIFDIDGKDLHLPCVPSHSYPICSNCGRVSPPFEKEYTCPACHGNKVDYASIPCNKCVEGSKKEVIKLVEFLTHDLGISKENIRIYFSGNNGFHCHINDGSYRPLSSQARSDLVGYLAGVGLMPESVGVRKSPHSNFAFVKFPRSGLDYGWRRRVAEELDISASSTIRLTNLVREKGGYSDFKAELERITRQMGIRIDPQVTTDVHRVFRLPGTLNSKSGLAKVRCDLCSLNSFDPFSDACLLGSTKVQVKMKTHTKARLKGQTFNISKERAELPAFAAVYFICKGLAETA